MHAPARRARTEGGFTLMEVLVALGVLSTALFALVSAHYSAMNLMVEGMDEADRRMLLESAVGRAEVAVMTGTLSGGGEFGAAHEGFSWSFEAVPAGTDEMVPLYQVTATLTTPDDTKSLDFFVFNNTESETSGGGELTGESSIRSGAASRGSGGTGAMQGMGARGSSRSSGGASSRGTSSRGRTGGMFSGGSR
jgi:prepilin-type N-terminal cleavage/methylation domain-containing protein